MVELIVILTAGVAALIVFFAAISILIGYITQASYVDECFCGQDKCDKCDS